VACERRFSGDLADRGTWMRRVFAGAFVALGAKLALAER
jgi:threonine/homoserine/homoserine lactone efflux protein